MCLLQSFEFIRGEASVGSYAAHSEGVYRIMAGNGKTDLPI